MENFYHLLGFHKLTDVTTVKMVEDHKLKKEDFFKYVKDGRITMDSTDAAIVGDYEADKVFFKLIAKKSRNLNLFVGYDDDVKRHFVSTFFVEMEKDKFLIKKDGDSQPLLKILSRKVIDTQNNAVIDFFIKWHNVRGEFINEPFYRGQTRLKTWINDKHISSKQVVNEIDTQRKLLKEYREEVERLRAMFEVLGLIAQLDIPEEKEEAQLKLMEYNIDVDNAEELESYKHCDMIQAKNDKLRMESKLAALENKLQKHEKYLPDIKELELQEVMGTYQVYLPGNQLERERVAKVLESNEIFDKTLSPEEFEKLYNETK